MGETSVTYRPDLGQVIDRQREWYEGKRKYLITIIPNRWNGYNWDLSIDIQTAKSLEEYDFRRDDQLFDFLDFRVKQYEYYWNLHGEWNLNDDFIPVFEPRLGWAEVVAPFVRDAVVQYYAQTSQIEPVVLDYDGFDWSRIGFWPDHPGAQLLEKMNSWCCERGRGRFLI